MRDAARGPDLARLRSTFQIVEGEVVRVIEGRSVLILRFSRDDAAGQPANPAEDEARAPLRGFSIAIKPAIARSWHANNLTLAQLEGRRIRVRGWIERRGGPAIEILDGHQIELVDAAEPSAVANSQAAPKSEPEPATPRRRSRKRAIEAAIAAPDPQ